MPFANKCDFCVNVRDRRHSVHFLIAAIIVLLHVHIFRSGVTLVMHHENKHLKELLEAEELPLEAAVQEPAAAMATSTAESSDGRLSGQMCRLVPSE